MPCILVVEGDIDQRAILLLALQQKGFKCIGAINGLDALNYIFDPFRKSNPYLILLDLSMPIMNGEKFLNVIRHCDNMKKVKIVIMTSDDTNIPKGYEFLIKPFYIDRLYQIAEKALKEF